jgi:hypothetical protein
LESAWNINYKYKDTKTDRPTEKKTDRQTDKQNIQSDRTLSISLRIQKQKKIQFEDIQIKKKQRDIMQQKQSMKK